MAVVHARQGIGAVDLSGGGFPTGECEGWRGFGGDSTFMSEGSRGWDFVVPGCRFCVCVCVCLRTGVVVGAAVVIAVCGTACELEATLEYSNY